MTFGKNLALALFAITLSAEAARAEGDWYVSASVGAYLRESASGPTTIGNGFVRSPGTDRFSFDAGPLVGLAVGYKLPAHFRVEVEADYNTYERSTVNPVSSGFPALDGSDFKRVSGGESENLIATVDLFYDIPINPVFVPYLGLGAGADHRHSADGIYIGPTGTRFQEFGGSHNYGVMVAEAGMSIALMPDLAVVPAYRYVHLFNDGPALGDEAAHVVKIGVRYSF